MSNSEHLTATMSVPRTPDEVMAAVIDVRGWWNANIIGETAAVGDEFVFTDDSKYAGETAKEKQGIRFARFQLTEVVPGARMVWQVIDSELTFIDDHSEWTGTTVVFDISATADGTVLRFTHVGLTAGESECFEECSRGWTFYITKSLPQLITTGTGDPIPSYRA
ncbi:SRPBCC domain-containing protein [Nocardia sp. NPDC050712]|uniref:SRPBCC family protein n=1 Tax=Nocardia sp. NPDC050712 TaxID=3155518 RepID=UPI0033DD4D97